MEILGSAQQRQLMTFGIAAAGAASFWLMGLILPFLFGPLCACLLAALLGFRLKGVPQIAAGARTIIGVAAGASVQPETLQQIPSMAASVALVPFYIGLIAVIGVPFFARVYKFDPVTSYYAAMPGGFQDMVVFGQEAGGDVRALSLIHATRVLVIITIAPFLMTHLFGLELTQPIGAPAADLPISEMLLMVAAALVGWKGGERIGLFGASVLGPLIVTGALSLMGFIHFRPPAEAILTAQFFIGMGIGVFYTGITLYELKRDVSAGIAYVVILAVLAAIFTEFVVFFGLASGVEGFLAFAPGGQAEMLILAIVAGAGLDYVVVHHLTRVLLVISLAPLVARALRLRKKPGPDHDPT